MIDLRRLLRRPRLLDEAWFALGGALAGGTGGLVVAALGLPPEPAGIATAPPLAHWLLALAPGFGLGWWIGLFWSVLLAVSARRLSPPPPVAGLLPVAALTVVLAVVGAAVARLAGRPPGFGIGAGLVVGTVVARVRLARAARRVSAP